MNNDDNSNNNDNSSDDHGNSDDHSNNIRWRSVRYNTLQYITIHYNTLHYMTTCQTTSGLRVPFWGSHPPWSCHTSCRTPAPFGGYDRLYGGWPFS